MEFLAKSLKTVLFQCFKSWLVSGPRNWASYAIQQVFLEKRGKNMLLKRIDSIDSTDLGSFTTKQIFLNRLTTHLSTQRNVNPKDLARTYQPWSQEQQSWSSNILLLLKNFYPNYVWLNLLKCCTRVTKKPINYIKLELFHHKHICHCYFSLATS